MNEQFQQYLMGILEKTGEFLGNEIPEVAHQILMFNLSIALLFVVLGLLCIPFGIHHIIKFFRIDGEADDGQCGILAFGGLAPTFAGSVLFFLHISTVLKIWLAPKLYLLEYAAGLVK